MAAERKLRLDVLALVIAALSMAGTLGNFVYNVTRMKPAMSLDCTPVLMEPAKIVPFFERGVVVWYHAWCNVTNRGSATEYIAAVDTTSAGAIGQMGTWGHGTTPGGFDSIPLKVQHYDRSTAEIRELELPLKVDPGATGDFVVTMSLRIAEEFIAPEEACAKSRDEGIVIPYHFLDECVNVDWYRDYRASQNLHEVQYGVEMSTTRKAHFRDDYTFDFWSPKQTQRGRDALTEGGG